MRRKHGGRWKSSEVRVYLLCSFLNKEAGIGTVGGVVQGEKSVGAYNS